MKPETLADKLGAVKEQQNALAARRKELETLLISSGVPEADGTRFRAVVIHSMVETVDRRRLIEALNPSPQRIAKYTTYAARVQVRVTAK